MRFSQRIGKTEVRTVLQREGIDDRLKNILWDLVNELIIKSKLNISKNNRPSQITKFFKVLWRDFYGKSTDDLHFSGLDYQVLKFEATVFVRDWFYMAKWYEIFDFIEFCLEYDKGRYINKFNAYLKKEMSAYRFIDGKLVEINSEEEIVEIENALINTDKFAPVKTHLQTALELLGDKKNPDYRNSIKESISAVESLIRSITGKNKFRDALAEIDKLIHIPNSLKEGFNKLYGYTSSKVGIRHAILDEDAKVELEEARFMLVTCSAFVNYVISKYASLTSKI